MKAIYLDTHVVVWLFSGLRDKLPEVAKIMIESNDLFICPIVILEIQFLKEIGRINYSAQEILEDLLIKIELKTDDLPFEIAIKKAIEIPWTRDPFDRVITASSIARSFPLITKDQNILSNYPLAIWNVPRPLAHLPK